MHVDMVALQDRLDVGDVVTRYAFAVDQHDWSAFNDIFADQVHLVVPHVEQGKPTLTRDEIVQLIRDTTSGFAATHHLIVNQLVTVDGDTASCKAYANAWHTLPTAPGTTDYVLVRGYYDFGLQRTPNGWRVSELVITFVAAEGEMELYELARQNRETAT